MLENNFNELDNDFVTLWSKYLVTGNLNLELLTKLAELGQVNAIQSYYLYEDEREAFPDLTIDKNCDKLANDYNGRYARLNRDYPFLNRSNPNTTKLFLNDGWGEMAKVITLAKMDYEENGNVLSGERYLEMLYSVSEANLDEESLDGLSKLAVKVRDQLEKEYENCFEPQYLFAIGKNMLLFGESKEEHKNGEELLKSLANREYSKKLSKHKTEFDNTRESIEDLGGYKIL